jgi:ketosteroid isomerase-like protein
MSRENVEFVRAALGGQKFDMQAMFGGNAPPPDIDLGMLADDVEIVFRPQLDAQTYYGVDGLAEGWREWLSAWGEYEAELEEYVDAGDHVVMLVHLRGETQHDNVVIEQPAAVVFTVEAGKVVRLAFHLDRRMAFEEAGRPELAERLHR